MLNDEIRVGIADMNIAFPPNRLITVGLGSCIGIALFDKKNNIGGLVHIMLPNSTQFTVINNPLKFADLAIPLLIKDMEKNGANKRNFLAKIAGGASMFNFSDKSMVMDIGNRNSASVKQILKKINIPIIAEDTGGNKGRTMVFDTKDGSVIIKKIGAEIKKL